jgi:5-carboxymethyl-2-hydroxymuconate isomerase
MPHLVIHCSESVTRLAAPEVLLDTVFEAAASTGLFASSGVGGIKVRLDTFRHYRLVEDREHFVHVFGYIMEGRTSEQKQALSTAVVGALTRLLPTVEIISMNVADFERESYHNADMAKPADMAG